METLMLSIMDAVQELLRETRGILLGLAVLFVGLIGVMTGRRLANGLFNLAADEEQPAAGARDRDADRDAAPEYQIPAAATMTGNVATLRWALRGLGLFGIAVVGLLMAVEKHGTEPILRWSLAKLEPKSGIQVTFESATGGLLSGKFVLHHVHVVRQNHPESNFDLTCSEVTARCSLWKILSPSSAFDGLRFEGVTGSYDRSRGPAKPRQPDGTIAEQKQPARNSRIGELEVVGANITFTDHTVEGDPVEMALGIDSLRCSPVRAAQAPFDLIFRSDAAGTIDGQPFVIQTTPSATATQTEWRATGLPVSLLRAYLSGPFRWLQSGECDVSVVQQMPNEPAQPVTLESHLVLRDIRPGVPNDTKPAVAVAAQLLMAQMKRLPREKDIGFTLKLDPAKFDLTRTEDREHLWQQYKAAAVAGLLQTAPIKIEGLSDETNERLENAVDKVTIKALKAIENIRIRRQARKAAKEGKAVPPAPEPQE